MAEQQRQKLHHHDQLDHILHEFCSLTSSSRQQAHFFLESSSWQLEPALQLFFETADPPADDKTCANDGEKYMHAGDQQPPPSAGPVQGLGSFPSSTDTGTSSKLAKSNQSASSQSGVKTLSDLSTRSNSESASGSPQEYYTGGEKSGMLVQGPSKCHGDIDAIFNPARRMGAQGQSKPPQVPSSSRTVFTGTGHTLAGGVRQQREEGIRSHPQPDSVVRSITFWRNGFTVDDGPLRSFDDPVNAQFLASISKSECPMEFEPADRGTPVHVNLIRKDDDWQPPLGPKFVPFKGVGRTLGSSSPSKTRSNLSPQVTRSKPFQGLVVDDLKPVTSIQVRLSDGTRMVAKFNHHHTVADIHGFIDTARPGNMRTYQLQTMDFPPKALTDLTQTVEQAGLINAVVIQKA